MVHTCSKYHLSWQIIYDTFVQEKQENKQKKKVKLQGFCGGAAGGGCQQVVTTRDKGKFV